MLGPQIRRIFGFNAPPHSTPDKHPKKGRDRGQLIGPEQAWAIALVGIRGLDSCDSIGR